jgi:ribose transport system substrate-binding protein
MSDDENEEENKMSRFPMIKIISLAMLGVLLVTGCAQATETPSAAQPAEPMAAPTEAVAEEIVIGHTWPDLQNPYYVSVRDATVVLMEELGYTYIYTDSAQDPAKQITDVENLIQRGAKVIFIDAVDPTAVVPAVEAANAAGIPVIIG